MSLQDALRQCADYNGQLEASKRLRGPFYWDARTQSRQCVATRVLSHLEPPSAPLLEMQPQPLPKDDAGFASQLLGSLLPLDAAHSRSRLTPAPREQPGDECIGCSKSVDPSCISCTSCLNTWHPACYQWGRGPQPKIIVCALCRTCERCGLHCVSSEQRLLCCSKCSACRHTHCAEPPISRLPSNAAWLCGRCVRCESCGTRSSDAWFDDYTMCGECSLKRRRGFCCPSCGLPDSGDEPAAECVACKRFVHVNGRCDGGTVTEAYWKALQAGTAAFTCSGCRIAEMAPAASQLELDRVIDEKLRALGRVGQGDVKRLGCDNCALKFNSSGELARHRKSAHPDADQAGGMDRKRRSGPRKRYNEDDDGEDFEEPAEEEHEEEADDEEQKKASEDESFRSEDEEEFLRATKKRVRGGSRFG